MNRGGKISDARAELARRYAEEPGGVPRYEARQAHLAAAARRERARAPRPSGWCILRTSSARTLPLAASLSAAGFEVWAPSEMRTRRLVRGRRAVTHRPAPLTPTFVFVRADRLDDLVSVLLLPINPHPPFSIFHVNGRAAIVREKDVAALRDAEDHKRNAWEFAERKASPPTFVADAEVRVDQTAFAGLVGNVEAQRGHRVMIRLGSMRLKVSAWQILPDAVQAGQPVEGSAA